LKAGVGLQLSGFGEADRFSGLGGGRDAGLSFGFAEA